MHYLFSEENLKRYDPLHPLPLNKRLRLLRSYNGLKQAEVAKCLGVDRSTYAYYELGKTRPSYETVILVSYLYDVSTDYLLGLKKGLGDED